MASILELTLQEKITTEILVSWLNNDSSKKVPECLQDLENVKQEFIPFFLNYLRDHTIHLIQSSKSATPSPAKTPSLKNLQKSVKRVNGNSSKRQQLFGASPAGDVDDLRNLPASVFSPNTSLESPGSVTINHKGDRNHSRGNNRGSYAGQKSSPQCGSQRSPYTQQTPDQRSKQKFSLGEFMNTPDQNNVNNSCRRKERRSDNTFSNVTITHNKKSGGKKRHSFSPLVHNNNISSNATAESSPAPVFSLNNMDFPQMSSSNSRKKNNANRHSLDSKLQTTTPIDSDSKTSRVINFSNNNSNDAGSISQFAERMKEVKRVSPVTVSEPRRVTPTLVKVDNSVQQNAAFLVPIEENVKKTTQSHTGNSGEPIDNIEASQDSLLEEKMPQREPKKKKNEPAPLIIPTPTKHSTSVTEIMEAYLGEVSQQDKLDILISLYSQCLNANLFPNLVVELYFLVQLLTARGGEVEDKFVYGDDVIEENYFSSVHNTVYFAVSILELQKRLLPMLDKCSLHLLLENARVARFSTDLQHYLESCYEKADTKRGPVFPRSPIGSVSFQADTDNRKNFPTEKSFHLFKKQRDGFYELLREWEASRMNASYNLAEMFGPRVRALISVKTELANLIHFARLFQSQLLAMCKGDGSIRTNEEDENIALLSKLKRSNPEKFKRLQERFIKPLSVGGPCPMPSFSGIQEFFRDFIVVASNPPLNQHLCDMFTAKILELNTTVFSTHDDEDAANTHGEEEEKELFCSVLLNLRLLGKFLGFVSFLPYQSPSRIPESMESTYINIRNKHLPALDLLSCLRDAIVAGNVSLTVPWVVEFLSMMDTLAPTLEYYQMVLYMTLYIHRYVWRQFEDEMSFGNLLIITLTSWLMENPVIPDGFFFSEIPAEVTVLVKGQFPSLAALDNRNFVDQMLFYTCCPYIGEVKTLLVDFAVGSSSRVSTVRKITPISADPPSQVSLTDRQLQLQMEENFFHNHPASMKRVVDFVADRTASNFIKKFRAGMMLDSFAEAKVKVTRQLTSLPDGSPSSKLKDRVSQVANKVAQEVCSHVKTTVMADAPIYCGHRVPPLMALLFPDDQSDIVTKMTSNISERLACEQISTWINKYFTIAMIQSEAVPDVDKLAKTMLQSQQQAVDTEHTHKPGNQSAEISTNQSAVISANQSAEITANQSTEITANQSVGISTSQSAEISANQSAEISANQSTMGENVVQVSHNESLRHPSELLIDFKDYMKKVMIYGWPLTSEKMDQLLSETRQMFLQRRDILPAIQKAYKQLTIDMVLSLLVQQSSAYSQILAVCMDLWKTLLHDNTSLNHIFSGRVVFMMEQAHNRTAVWKDYTKLLLLLHREKLIQVDGLQEAGLTFISYIQDGDTVAALCECLCSMAKCLSELERTDRLGGCLQLLYNKLPDAHCEQAMLIMDTLGLNNNTDFTVQSLESPVKGLRISNCS